MIIGMEGLMGGGKSYELVRYHVLPALEKGRKVITNLPLVLEVWEQLYPELVHLIEIRTEAKPVLGTWDVEAANRGELAFKVGEFPPEERLRLVDGKPYLSPVNKAPFSGVWCFYDTWRGPKGIGPLYIIDECHVSFPKAKPMKRIDTPEDIVQFMKLSRHFGVDLTLATQRFSSVHEDVRELIQIHHKVMKAIALGDSGSYIKKTLNGYRGAEISVSTRKYESYYFSLYKSHTQGSAVVETQASDVSSFVHKWKKWTKLYWVFCLVVVVWAFWPESKPEPAHVQKFKQELSKVPPGQVLSQDSQGNLIHIDRSELVPKPAPHTPPAEPPPPKKMEPLEGKTIHLSGWMEKGGKTVFTFEIAKGEQRIFTSDNVQLERAGYKFELLGECMGIITYDGVARPVSCDAPRLAVGQENKPIVISEPRVNASAPTGPAHALHEPDYPHPFTAASKTSRLAAGGML